jgi:glycosyltransferase 2 family protein
VLTAAGYLAAAVAQLGAVDPPLALGRTTLVQVASSFANRLTPGSLGGMGLNVRYLQRAGMDRPSAVGAVAVNTAAGALVHVLGLLVATALIGRARLGTAHIPKGWPALVGLVAALAIGGLALWSPAGHRRVVTPTLRAGRELAAVLRRPGKAAQLLGGSAGVTLTYALTLACSLAAVDAHVALASTVAVYLAGAAVASVSPTPGGLGPWRPPWSPGSPPSAPRPGRRSPGSWPFGCSPSGCRSCPAG